MGDITDNFLAPCSRSQTVPNMATLTSEAGEREVTSPDSLLSDTKEATDLRLSGQASPVTVSKTPDSALSSVNARKSGRLRSVKMVFSSVNNLIMTSVASRGRAVTRLRT